MRESRRVRSDGSYVSVNGAMGAEGKVGRYGIWLILGMVIWFGVFGSGVLATPTLVNISEELDGEWGIPRINNLGHIIMTQRDTSSYGGAAWFFNGSSWSAVPNVASVEAVDGLTWRLNDNDRFVYADRSSNHVVHVADPNGDIVVLTKQQGTFAGSINNSNTLAVYRYGGYSSTIQLSEPPYTDFTQVGSPAYMSHLSVDINNSGQVVYRTNAYGIGTVYLYTPDIGVRTIGSASSQVSVDDYGRVLRGYDKVIYLGNQAICTLQRNDFGAGLAVSDNGKVVWTEYNGSRFDVFTFVDGVRTCVSAGRPDIVSAVFPDINNDGEIVFMNATGTFTSDVFLWTPDSAQSPIVYNGHFDGNTLYGWDVIASGAAVADLVLQGAGDYAVRLTTGSPVSISQLIETPSQAFYLDFDCDFETVNGDARLDVLLGGITLMSLPAVVSDEQRYHLLVDNPALMGLEDAALTFTWDGTLAGSVSLLDNIAITPVPEPLTGMIVFLGGAGLFYRRRSAKRNA